ncbi:MAG: hypothetical protein KF784_09160 [Fimbriimonadaceae bacterium]|nr:hypothetical protein [Fimbriimonadaceae bacterium]
MGSKLVIILVGAVLFTVAVPFFAAKRLQLGTFAKSPQVATMTLGSTVVIAGGRAKLWYAGGDTGGDFEIQCSKGAKYCQPSQRFEEFESNGVTVQLIEIDDRVSPFKAKFKITWDDKAK